MKEDAYWIRDQVQQHNKWFEESIPMIASENLMSPLAKEMMGKIPLHLVMVAAEAGAEAVVIVHLLI